jgi:MinD superfamily P-loop ATPase
VACDDKAISEKPEPIGKVSFYELADKNKLIEGKLKIGSAMQTMLIRELKKHVSEDTEIILYDAPPGTSCPVVETIGNVDFVILVSEPTPFGMHDLKLMIELIKELDKPFGLIVNKSGIGDKAIYEYVDKEQISLIGEIPYNQEYAASYANGNLDDNVPAEITKAFVEIITNIKSNILHK